MASTNHNLGGNYWGYLIEDNKSATPLLDQLCVGLAHIIGQLEPTNAGPQKELTPQRLAAFYRSVGGDYDAIFLRSTSSGLSFMYSTMGCYHTLQPAGTPFRPPSLPALTAQGFSRWQTIQLLLNPNEHVRFLQEAVKKYDVARPEGGFFPKHIPREAFPDRPDEAMENWHREVTGRLSQEQDVRRLKYSPYPSPYNGPERNEGYFSPDGRLPIPQIRRPSRPSRNESYEQDLARRRSSVPDIPSPLASAGALPSDPYGQSGDFKKRTSRSQSAHRPSTTTSPTEHRAKNSSQYASNPSNMYRPQGNSYPDSSGVQTGSSRRHQRQKSGPQRARSPSTVGEVTGSEGSSENSQSGHAHGKPREDRRHSSLWVPNFLNHKRRHSHDASYLPVEKPPALPPRPVATRHHTRQRSGTHSSPIRRDFQSQSPTAVRPNGPGVRFREQVFDGSREEVVNSAPETRPMFPYNAQPQPQPQPLVSQSRSVDPPPLNKRQIMDVGAPLSRESSGTSGNDRGERPKDGVPLRVTTVSGVGGRRYPNAEPKSAVERRHTAALPV